MKAALVSLGSVSSKITFDAMEKYFDSVDMLNIKDIEITLGSKDAGVLVEGKPMKKYDCVYAKGSFRYNPILRALTSALEGETYVPIRSDAFTIGHDKFLTHLLMEKAQIPMPGTYIASSVLAAKKLLERVNYPVILKLPQGTQGKGVLFADTFAAASSILDTLISLKQPFIIQEYVETGGTDIRAIVIGGKVVAAMKRRALSGEKRANIHAGGKGEMLNLDANTKKIAVKAAEVVGCGIAAVDILESIRGPLVIELNLSPGLQGIMNATSIDVPDMIAKYLHEETKKMVDTKKGIDSDKIFSDIGLENVGSQEIITHIDQRADRMLLPKVITKMSGFDESAEYVVSVKKGEIKIKRM